jgi:hypothetical protein
MLLGQMVPLFVLDQSGVRRFAPTTTTDARRASAVRQGTAAAPRPLIEFNSALQTMCQLVRDWAKSTESELPILCRRATSPYRFWAVDLAQ